MWARGADGVGDFHFGETETAPTAALNEVASVVVVTAVSAANTIAGGDLLYQ